MTFGRSAGIKALAVVSIGAMGLTACGSSSKTSTPTTVATGSATVAITTAAALMAPEVALHPGTNVELLVISMGCGSLFLSHLNDGGFWIVKECLGLTVGQTLRTWTMCETIIGVAGLALTLLANALV